MTSDRASLAQLVDALDALRQEVARLAVRVAQMETTLARAQESGVRNPESGALSTQYSVLSSPKRAAAPTNLVDDAGLSEELLVVISAAIAAFLGKKPH